MVKDRWILVVLAILIMLLVGIQVFWIQKSTQLNRDQFDKSVQFALQSLSRKMETREAYGFVEKKVNVNTRLALPVTSNDNWPVLGAMVMNIDTENASAYDLKSTYGVYVTEVVPSSPAFFAGIKEGDVITEIDEKPVNSVTEMRARMSHYRAGDQINITYERPSGNFSRNDEIALAGQKIMMPLDTIRVSVESNLLSDQLLLGDSCTFEVILDSTKSAKKIIVHNGNGKNVTYYTTLYNPNTEPDYQSTDGLNADDKDSIYRMIQEAIQDSSKNISLDLNGDMDPDHKANIINKATDIQNLDSTIRFIQNVVGRMTSRKKLEDKIALYNIDKMLTDELTLRGMSLHPEWAVLNQENDILLCSKEFGNQYRSDSYQTELFPNNPLDEPAIIQVYFPEKEKYLVRHNILLPLFAFFIIIGILAIFVFTYKNLILQTKISDLKTDFINNMTHELKTPVSTIKLAAEMLLDKRPIDEGKRNRYTYIIQEENQRLSTQIEKVLQIARIEKGELELHKEKLNVHEILEEAITHVQLHLELKNGNVVRDLKLTNPYVYADPVHLKNVFVNLMDNAIKYTPQNPLIKVSTADAGEEMIVRIADNGIGISKEAQKKIFEKFYRVPTGNLHDVKGFGLGLSYVKLMIEAHGGSINVQSKPNEGSIFEIQLPDFEMVKATG